MTIFYNWERRLGPFSGMVIYTTYDHGFDEIGSSTSDDLPCWACWDTVDPYSYTYDRFLSYEMA